MSMSIAEVHQQLMAKYRVFRHFKPLKIGVHKDIQLEGVSSADIMRALRRHTRTKAYLRAIKFGVVRFNLDESVANEIQSEHKEMAKLHLQMKFLQINAKNYKEQHNIKTLPVEYVKRMKQRASKLQQRIEALKSN